MVAGHKGERELEGKEDSTCLCLYLFLSKSLMKCCENFPF